MGLRACDRRIHTDCESCKIRFQGVSVTEGGAKYDIKAEMLIYISVDE